MAWTTGDTVMGYRERWRWFDVFAEMMDGWRRHQGGRNASLLAFFSFLSIFPLFLAAITILGFVLQGNPDLRQSIVNGAITEIPVLGDQLLEDGPGSINGSWLALIVGLGGALYSSTKAFVALQTALDDSWEIPLDDRDSFQMQRGKALLGICIIGGSQVASLAVTSIVSAAAIPGITQVLLQLLTFVVNIVVIGAMFRWMTAATPTWRDVWPGAVLAGVVITLLQIFGARLVQQFADSGKAYGAINTVIGIVSWLSFIGIAVVMSAELNAAIKRLGDEEHIPSEPQYDLPVRA